jgi:hypothetical protein
MMENAAYAVHIQCNPKLARVWLDRHVGEAGMKSARKNFRHELVVESVSAANMHAGKRLKTCISARSTSAAIRIVYHSGLTGLMRRTRAFLPCA